MKTTRQKRPDRVICKWNGYEVELIKNKIYISDRDGEFSVYPLSEIPNLIKALTEVSREVK